MKRVAIIASASGNGKTTVGRELARRFGAPFVELDALVHGPGWAETPDHELRGLRGAFWGRDSLFAWSFRSHFRRRRQWPGAFDGYPVVRLRSTREVEQWLTTSG